jgi:hypothetical protein
MKRRSPQTAPDPTIGAIRIYLDNGTYHYVFQTFYLDGGMPSTYRKRGDHHYRLTGRAEQQLLRELGQIIPRCSLKYVPQAPHPGTTYCITVSPQMSSLDEDWTRSDKGQELVWLIERTFGWTGSIRSDRAGPPSWYGHKKEVAIPPSFRTRRASQRPAGKSVGTASWV